MNRKMYVVQPGNDLIYVSTAPLFLFILSPANNCDKSQNTFLSCKGYSAFLRSFSHLAENLSPSL